MTVGMELYDSAHILQAATAMLSHFCRKSAADVTVANTAGGAAASMAKIAVTGYHKPIIAIQCGSTMAYAGITGGFAYYWCSGAIGTSFTYYIFDTLEGVATAHIGLETYDASGNISFSSNYQPMEILGINPGTTTYAGKQVAAALPSWGSTEFVGGLQCWDTGAAVPWTDPAESGPCGDLRYNHIVNVRGAFIDSAGSRINPNNITYENVMINAGTSSSYTHPSSSFPHNLTLFALDVTNIPLGTFF